MKHIKTYQVFESSSAAALTEEQISWLDRCTTGSWKFDPQTGLVNVDRDFDCDDQNLQDFKGVRFGKVNRNFNCSNNQLTSLEGAPQTVNGIFYCGENQLTTLAGAPQRVGGSFDCAQNQLTSLVGAPQTVNGSFYCNDNQLTSLVGAPQTAGGSFDCSDNQLTSLVGAPQTVGGHFDCRGNTVSVSTLTAIFDLMRKGKRTPIDIPHPLGISMGYQQALEEYWVKMSDEDKVLMYKQMLSLSPEETRKYQALAKYISIKGYL